MTSRVLNIATYQFAVRASKKQNFKCIICFYAFNCLVIAAIYGCTTQQNLLAEKDKFVANVRSVVLERGQMLSDQEKVFIMQSNPETRQYKMAGTFGQYSWHWSLPTGRSIDVSYTGDLATFDTHKIIIQLDEADK